MNRTQRDRAYERVMDAHAIVHPRITLDEVQRVHRHRRHLPLSVACGLLIQESGGGHNVFGHDPTIFVGAGQVTKAKYLAYKRQRGHTRMQGVGGLQLTYWSIQDAADAMGGCWRPRYNFREGLELAASLIVTHGLAGGLAAYNAGSPTSNQGLAYSRSVRAIAAVYHQRFRRAERALGKLPLADRLLAGASSVLGNDWGDSLEPDDFLDWLDMRELVSPDGMMALGDVQPDRAGVRDHQALLDLLTADD